MLGIALLTGGCTLHREYTIGQPLGGIKAPLISRLPIAIGLHYPSAFDEPLTIEHTEYGIPSKQTFHSEGVRTAIDMAAQSRFSEVIAVKDWNPGKPNATGEWNFLMVPRATHLGVVLASSSPQEVWWASAEYEFTLYDQSGQQIASHKVRGHISATSTDTDLPRYRSSAYFDTLITRAVRDALAAWLVQFCHIGSLQKRISACASEVALSAR